LIPLESNVSIKIELLSGIGKMHLSNCMLEPRPE